MARKKQSRPPKVPRSNIRERSLQRAAPQPKSTTAAAVGDTVRASRPARHIPDPPTLAEQYAHVKKDLVRITIFGTLIFGAMFALKFMGM